MDLTPESFEQSFAKTEVRSIKLKTMDNGVIYLRALSRADIIRYRTMIEVIKAKVGVALLGGQALMNQVKDQELDAAEDIIIMRTLCNADGSRFFEKEEQYKKWAAKVDTMAVEEILKNINDNLFLYSDSGEEHEKK